jgi:hypothetical protein
VSLILDALRKLERERDPNQPPGVLVVGSVPWGETSRRRRVAIAAGIAAVLALAVLAGWMLRPALKAPAAATPSATPPVLESRPSSSPLASSMPDLPNAAAPSEQPPPPIRLSKPPSSAAMRGAQAPSPTPSPTDAASEPAPEAERQPVPTRESISVSPGVEGEAAPPAPPPGELRLNAVSRRDGRPVALINDRLVFEGDSFDGVRVIRIGEAEVEVEVKGQRQVLRF